MIELSVERLLPAAPRTIWPWIDNPERFAKWFTFAERVEILDGVGVGSRRRQHGHWGKKASEVDQLVTEYEENERLGWTHEAERLDGKPAPKFARSTFFTIELIPESDKTLVRMTSRQEPAGPIRGLVMKGFGMKELRAGLEKSLDDLTDLVAGPRVDL